MLKLNEKFTPTEWGNMTDEHDNGSKIEGNFKRQRKGQNCNDRKQQKQYLAITVALAALKDAADRIS